MTKKHTNAYRLSFNKCIQNAHDLMWKWKMDRANLTNFLSDWKAFYKNNSGLKKDFDFHLIILYYQDLFKKPCHSPMKFTDEQ